MDTTTTKVNFNYPLLDLEGKDMQANGAAVNAGKMLARFLSNLTRGDTFKLMEWARKCYEGTDIELNPKERKELYNHINDSEQLTVLFKEQLLTALN